jgi:hypothetical protein
MILTEADRSTGRIPVTLTHHKSHVDWPELNPGLRGEGPATNRNSGLVRGVVKGPILTPLYHDTE